MTPREIIEEQTEILGGICVFWEDMSPHEIQQLDSVIKKLTEVRDDAKRPASPLPLSHFFDS